VSATARGSEPASGRGSAPASGLTTETQATESPDRGTAHADPAFANILCALDGSRRSYVAVEQAAALAGPAGHLTLLAVTAVAGTGAYKSAAIGSARGERVLGRAARIAERAGVSSTKVVDPGAPASAVILERAVQHDLLAIGAPAMGRVAGMLVGGVAFDALGSFTTPLLLARPAPQGLPFARSILVASDALEGSDRLVELAGRIARDQEARLVLVHAPDPESRAPSPRIQAQAHAVGLLLPSTSETVIEAGSARDVIVDCAGRAEVSLVVMGSRRRRGLRALGSVSKRVVHEAPCSVLLVPPEAISD
jgi:nucleotide-binding universal stress UspA family protein